MQLAHSQNLHHEPRQPRSFHNVLGGYVFPQNGTAWLRWSRRAIVADPCQTQARPMEDSAIPPWKPASATVHLDALFSLSLPSGFFLSFRSSFRRTEVNVFEPERLKLTRSNFYSFLNWGLPVNFFQRYPVK